MTPGAYLAAYRGLENYLPITLDGDSQSSFTSPLRGEIEGAGPSARSSTTSTPSRSPQGGGGREIALELPFSTRQCRNATGIIPAGTSGDLIMPAVNWLAVIAAALSMFVIGGGLVFAVAVRESPGHGGGA